MPDRAAHLKQAKHNKSALGYLQKRIADFPDWVVVVAFYAALHYVEAVFATDKDIQHGQSHGRRLEMLKSKSRYKDIFMHYRILKNYSEIARYLEDEEGKEICFVTQFPVARVEQEVVRHHLKKVESSALTLLKSAAAGGTKRKPRKSRKT